MELAPVIVKPGDIGEFSVVDGAELGRFWMYSLILGVKILVIHGCKRVNWLSR